MGRLASDGFWMLEEGQQRKRVLFVSNLLGAGGAERFISTVLSHLDRSKFDLRLCTFRPIVSYPLPDDVPLNVLHREVVHKNQHIPIMIWRLARLVAEQKPDVILSAYSYPSFIVGCALLLLRRRPRWIARVSNDPDKEESGIRRCLMRFLYRRAGLVVANSEALASEFARIYSLPRTMVAYLPNAADFSRIDHLAREPLQEKAPDGPLVVAVGRLSPQKRVDLLIDAIAQVRKKASIHLVICGDGSLRGDLEERVRALGLEANVTLIGFQSNPFRWMAAADIYVLCSDYEGSPNALIEAQGLRLPAIATNCDFGVNEIIDSGVTGLLVPPGDVEKLADAIHSLVVDSTRRFEMGAAGERRVRRLFDAESVCAKLASYLFAET